MTGTALRIVLGLCLCTLPFARVVHAQHIEWETLDQEVMTLRRQGQYARAVVVAKKALEVAEKAPEPDHRAVATSLNNLAGLYQDQGQYVAAEPLYKRSLAISEKALGPDHPNIAISLNNLAELYRVQGQPAAAEPLYKRSLAIREKALGPGSSDKAFDAPAVDPTELTNLGLDTAAAAERQL